MGKEKAGFLTPKAIANRIKAKGLQKLRWFCQMCQKQCRDEVCLPYRIFNRLQTYMPFLLSIAHRMISRSAASLIYFACHFKHLPFELHSVFRYSNFRMVSSVT